MDTEKQIGNIRKKLNKCIKTGRYSKAMSFVSILSGVFYRYNQFFVDNQIEEAIDTIVESFGIEKPYIAKDATILYYDGFGNDVRGLTIEYVLGLCKLGYEVIYITDIRSKEKQKIMHSLVDQYNIKYEYFSKRSHVGQINMIRNLFLKYHPRRAFVYTWPHDVAGIVAFQLFKNTCDIYKINLTDDYFWAGVNSFHYLIEFRNWGASVSVKYRGIDRSKILILPYYPFCIEKEFSGVPFDESQCYIFSGGSLYKTFDKNLTYYKMMDLILEHNKQIVFFYVGNGDNAELIKLKEKYIDRVYYQKERTDFFEVMRRCTLYVDSYPESGGLMVQYAVAAGKLPLMLKNDESDDGEILLNQSTLGIEFNDEIELEREVRRCLENKEYLKKKEGKVKNSIIDEIEFNNQLKNVLEGKRTDYLAYDENINIKSLKQRSMERFDYSKVFIELLVTRANRSLFFLYPIRVTKRIISKAFSIINRGKK